MAPVTSRPASGIHFVHGRRDLDGKVFRLIGRFNHMGGIVFHSVRYPGLLETLLKQELEDNSYLAQKSVHVGYRLLLIGQDVSLYPEPEVGPSRKLFRFVSLAYFFPPQVFLLLRLQIMN